MTSGGTVRVLLAVTGRPYEEHLLAVLAAPESRLVLGRRCLDLADLAQAAGTPGDDAATVAVVSSALHRLDRVAVQALGSSGVRVVVVAEPAPSQDPVDLDAAATVTAPVPSASGQVLPRALAAFGTEVAAQVLAVAPPAPAVRTQRERREAHAGPPDLPAGGGEQDAGRLVAVWGPTGAPGRTSVAITLADELARSGTATTLVDADTYGPCVAQRLGVLDEASGLAAVARAADDGTLDAQTWAASARRLPDGLLVLTGLTRADRWAELSVPALAAVWRQARRTRGATVLDCGFCLEEDEELAYDGVVVRRNAATLTALAAADVVVVVGAADPVGLTRLVRGVHELDDLAGRRPGAVPTERRLVLTRVRPGVLGRGEPGRAVRQLLGRAGLPAQEAVLVPDDPGAFDRAHALGRTLGEAAPRSPSRAALSSLAPRLVRSARA